jgi:hypothetical protein
MRAWIAILLLWAVVATVAAVFPALQSTPSPSPTPAPRSEPEPPRKLGKSRSAVSLEGFLALTLEPPAAESTDGRPVEVRVRELLEEYRKLGAAGESQHEIYRKLLAMVAYEPDSHLALMNLLRGADEERASDVLGFLVWNPWASQLRGGAIVEKIRAAAREMITNDPSVARREAAIRVLFRYGGGDGRKAFDFGFERLEVEPSIEVRDVLLDEMSVVGHRLGLTREEAAPFVDRLRTRLEDGEAWCAVALAWWSTDEEDFRRIRDKLENDRRPQTRQIYLDAIRGDMAIVRDRTAEARALLIRVMEDPTENDNTRSVARSYLAETFGPIDAESAGAIRRFDYEREYR